MCSIGTYHTFHAKLTGCHVPRERPQKDKHPHRAGQGPETTSLQPDFMVIQAQRLRWQRT